MMLVFEKDIETLRKEKLEELNKYTANLLSKTDYVVTKIKEAEVLGFDTTDLITKYQTVLQERQNIRSWHDNIETLILNATTKEELKNITIKY